MTDVEEKILILGMGKSGVAALQLLKREPARITLYDRDPARLEGLGAGIEKLSGPELPELGAFDRIIVSPGIRVPSHPNLQPEIDLAALYLKAPVIGVTGTNGKSTTAVLIGEMLRRSGLAVPIGGNLGDPLCSLVDAPADAVVVELSSFQLEHAAALRVQTGVLLNLSPDHLDRHGSIEAYGAAKARLATLQQAGDSLIVNLDDPWARDVGATAVARTLGFSATERQESGACVEDRDLVLREGGREVLRIALEKLSPACRTPIDNALASTLAASVAGASPEAIRALLESFEGLPHRARLVAVRQRVRYVDDSKATNPHAAMISVGSQPQGTIWILGGRNKGLDLSPLAEAAAGTRAIILYGEAATDLAAVFEDAVDVVRVETLDQAVKEASARALPGGTVLLAPACSSFDQFASFEDRGQHFIELTRGLPESSGC